MPLANRRGAHCASALDMDGDETKSNRIPNKLRAHTVRPYGVSAGFGACKPLRACHCGLDPQSPPSTSYFIKQLHPEVVWRLRVKPAMTSLGDCKP